MARHVAFSGKALRLLREPELVAHEVHEVGGVLAVVDGEGGLEPDRGGVHPQQPRADGVEGAGPADGVAGAGLRLAERGGDDALDAALHLGRGPAGEGQQQDAAGIGAVDDQVGDAVGERVGLARAGAGDDQQRAGDVGALARDAVLDGAPLLRIEAFEIARARHRQGTRIMRSIRRS